VENLTPYRAADRADVERFLAEPPRIQLYLLSRLTTGRGEGHVFRRGGRVRGFAWFGRGRNLAFAGDSPAFLTALAELAANREMSWVMMVASHGPATDFLAGYLPRTRRKARLDRAQAFYALTAADRTGLREPRLRPATEADVDLLVPAAARMSGEDFEIDAWRIDREAVRHSMATKVREGRAFLLEEDGRLLFKVDLAVRHPEGAQIEGVFTPEECRGRGIASRCMAEVGRRLLADVPEVNLHVSAENAPAIRAYEKAGFRRKAELRLVIFRLG
jgi:ribosomal protein S18 acetylase RimI-like enzyme